LEKFVAVFVRFQRTKTATNFSKRGSLASRCELKSAFCEALSPIHAANDSGASNFIQAACKEKPLQL